MAYLQRAHHPRGAPAHVPRFHPASLLPRGQAAGRYTHDDPVFYVYRYFPGLCATDLSVSNSKSFPAPLAKTITRNIF